MKSSACCRFCFLRCCCFQWRILDQQVVHLGSLVISRGWVTFLAIFIKTGLTVTASLLLIATTGIENLCAALRMLKVPKIFVLQLLLTYRYISVLTEELSRMLRAYQLRAPGQKGIQRNAWGSFAGGLILRTFDRAQRVYASMSLRGFNGEYHPGSITAIRLKDFSYLVVWLSFFLFARLVNLPLLIGNLVAS
jgi:cobalt/nickel transport system permease protein